MNERVLRELQNHSNEVFNTLNIELSDILNKSFNEYLKNSVTQMEHEKRNSETDIKEAKKAFTVFINKMCFYRETRLDKKDLLRLIALNETTSYTRPLLPI